MTADFLLCSFNVKNQLQNEAYRAACLETLAPGDVVQAICTETGEVRGTRLLEAVDSRWNATAWPQRYVAGDWRADSRGYELNSGQERMPMGWVLVRPPLTPQAAAPLLRAGKPKPAFSWGLYERHMRLTHLAVMEGTELPEEPWE